MLEVKEQCKKCFHFQVCANVLKQQLFIREKLMNEENPKCEYFIPVAGVRHAKWIYKYEDLDVAYCSICNFYCQDKINNISFSFRYCPNCGAKMDLKGGADE